MIKDISFIIKDKYMALEQPKIYLAKQTGEGAYICPVCNVPHMKKEVTPVICPFCGTRLYYDADEWMHDSKISSAEIKSLIDSAASGLDDLFNLQIEEFGYKRDYAENIKEALAHKRK